jgi:hypothetical protein
VNDSRSTQDDAERRLDEHLGLLRTRPPEPGTMLVPRVVRAARLQRLLRVPIDAVAGLAGAVASGVAALLGLKRR